MCVHLKNPIVRFVFQNLPLHNSEDRLESEVTRCMLSTALGLDIQIEISLSQRLYSTDLFLILVLINLFDLELLIAVI